MPRLPRLLRRARIAKWRAWRWLQHHTLLWLFLGVSSLYVGLVAFWINSFARSGGRHDASEMFDALDSYFGALALAGVIYTLMLQRRELALQRRELQLSRQQLVEQNQIHLHRLQMEQAAMQPVLRFVSISAFDRIEPERAGDRPSIRLTLGLVNDGGAMHHAEGRMWFWDGPFSELYPRDQDEDGVLSCSARPEDDLEHYIPSRAECSLFLRCLVPRELQADKVDPSFNGRLILRYLNALSRPRVSEYQIEVGGRPGASSGRLFLLRDIDPLEASRAGLLNSYPGMRHSTRRRDEIALSDLYPGLE